MFPVFEKLAIENGWRGIPASFSGCAPLFDVFRLDGIGNASNCTGEYSQNVKNFISDNRKEIQKIFLVSRWNLYEQGWIKNGRLQKATHFLSDKDINSQNAEDSSKVLEKAIIRTISKLSEEYNIETNIIKSVPILYSNIRENIPKVTRDDYLRQREFTDKAFNHFSKNPLVNMIDPINIFCPTDKCIMYENDKALYKDDNHVSSYGSLLFYSILKQYFKE